MYYDPQWLKFKTDYQLRNSIEIKNIPTMSKVVLDEFLKQKPDLKSVDEIENIADFEAT